MGNSRMPSFSEDASGYLPSSLATTAPYTASEYFTALLGRAIQAVADGDYGIGAALVVRYPDIELVSLARNTIISTGDPLGHAETNAIRQFHAFLGLSSAARARNALPWTDPVSAAESRGGIFVRPAPATLPCQNAGEAGEAAIYTTLEPCPMCTVAILNSRISKVIITVPDEEGGALAPRRLARLPAIFPRVAASQGLRVAFTSDSEDGAPDTFVPEPLSMLLHRAFLETREECDAQMEKGILFGPGTHSKLSTLVDRDLTATSGQPG